MSMEFEALSLWELSVSFSIRIAEPSSYWYRNEAGKILLRGDRSKDRYAPRTEPDRIL